VASGSDGPAPRLAIATCAELPELDPEGRLLAAELRNAGIGAEPAIWDDPGLEWASFDRVLLRSTWDYPQKHEAFSDWVRERGSALINAPALVQWNLSKRYLGVLQGWGFPTVPTRFLAPGERPGTGELGEFVVKPAISAGSRDTARYRPDEIERAAGHARSLQEEGREVIVQPYLRSVETEAETAVIVLGGRCSHAMRKAPLLRAGQELEQGLFREEEMENRRARPAQIELAEAIVATVAAEVAAPLYARLDLLDGDDGKPRVLELELIEPSLFIDRDPAGAARLVTLLGEELAG